MCAETSLNMNDFKHESLGTHVLLDYALSQAIYAHDLQAMQEAIDKGASVQKDIYRTHASPLYIAYCARDYKAFELLIKNGADVNENLSQHGNSLLSAVYDPKVVEILLKHGADVNHADKEGYTPLHNVCSHANSVSDTKKIQDHLKIIALLVAYNTDVYAKTNSGKTPLDIARDPAIQKYLQGCIAYEKEQNSIFIRCILLD